MLMPLFVLYIFMSIRTTLFLESANPVAVQLLLASAAAATLVFVVVSVCRAAASAAAAAARHALCLFFFFFVLHNADVFSTDFFFRIWAEHANITHLQCTSVC